MINSGQLPSLSGARFRVQYRLAAQEHEARAIAEQICLEQTVEFPDDLLPKGLRDRIVGRIEALAPAGSGDCLATISFAVETAGDELLQLLNVLFGNISLKPGIRVERLELTAEQLAGFGGPRFGISGVRELLAARDRPILATALKPMGLSVRDLAEFAYQFALGGIDIIKDDHGLTDQVFSRFTERVSRCSAAVARANAESGGHCLYAPNITGPADQMMQRARFAQSAGAGALLISPGLQGLDAVRCLSGDGGVALPILAHPAFQGALVTNPTGGIAHGVAFGLLPRLAGADATIFPNFGGRFSFSRDECRNIAAAARAPLGSLRPVLPSPAGGMTLARVPEIVAAYGHDVILLIGGDLYRHSGDLFRSCHLFRRSVEEASRSTQ